MEKQIQSKDQKISATESGLESLKMELDMLRVSDFLFLSEFTMFLQNKFTSTNTELEQSRMDAEEKQLQCNTQIENLQLEIVSLNSTASSQSTEMFGKLHEKNEQITTLNGQLDKMKKELNELKELSDKNYNKTSKLLIDIDNLDFELVKYKQFETTAANCQKNLNDTIYQLTQTKIINEKNTIDLEMKNCELI